jgi:predicted ATPase
VRAAGALPAPPNATIGREREIAEVGERLRSSDVRLLTLTGTGGVGKTRLALEVAHSIEGDFADGAHFAPLAAVQQSDDVADAIVRSLGIVVLSGESSAETVGRFLSPKHALLVADNFEHVLDAAPLVGELLARCPGLTVLATSREPLALHAEQRYVVSPLALPDRAGADDATLPSAAVVLFAARARGHDPAFELDSGNAVAVADICRRVDGLPLAIELAAARCGLMSAGEIAARLDGALGILGASPRDAPARQQTLRATMSWSHDLLSDEEKAAFARFAVFAGGATADAAEEITGADLDTLDHLVAKSLLVRRRRPGGESTRLGMLETVRAYAEERFLAAPDRDEVRWRHYRYYHVLARRHASDRALWGTEHREHLATLDVDSENLDAALRWAADQAAGPALDLCEALGTYWLLRSRNAHVLEWTDRVLGMADADAHPAARVRVLCTKAWCLFPLGLEPEQPSVTAEAESIATRLGDPVLLSRVAQIRAVHEAAHVGRLDVADAFAVEALRWARIAKDDWMAAMAAYARAMAAEDPTEVRARVGEAAALLEQVGNLHLVADMLAAVTYSALLYEGYDDAREFVGRAMALAKDLEYPFLQVLVRGNFARTSLLTGEVDAARRAFRETLELCREHVVVSLATGGLQGLAAIAAACDNEPERAARLAGAADAHRYGAPVDAVETRVQATFIEPARSQIDADAWFEAFHQGASLSFEAAIAYALGERNG